MIQPQAMLESKRSGREQVPHRGLWGWYSRCGRGLGRAGRHGLLVRH